MKKKGPEVSPPPPRLQGEGEAWLSEAPFPESDLSPAAQRTIQRLLEEGDDKGGDDFLTLLERATKEHKRD